MLTERNMRLTEINISERKNRATGMMTFIETVSIFVLRAMSFMSFVMVTMLSVEHLLAFVFC